ncbi:DUF4349 domain-containing protein [Cellulomonas sp. URHE0023]|uniref:DUF4349 domain-containing protein n=1 Tax=Cellulomonas sp. URHE0023 TaxID=1380354 RepID=UPI00047F744C|nr:DUF4349 domain-containing protein [Cellulomonas sp. URHE0023]
MKPSTSHRSRSTAHRGAALAAAAVLTLSALLAGCSAGDASGSADQSVQEGTDLGSADAPADVGADATGDVAGPSTDPADSGTDAAATSVDDHRQVIQTGEIAMTVDSPQESAEAIVALAEKSGGRIDNRTERAATETSVATAELKIRIPSSAVNATVLALRSLGSVDTIELGTQDVTGAAEDLDARIAGMELSVARMAEVLSKAGTSAEIADAEATLTERQSDLEQLKSEKARLAEQVALSTLTIALQGPAVAAPPAPPEPAPAEPGPDSFLEGLSAGWSSLVGILSGVATVLGVLLPYLVVGGLVTWGVFAVVRRYRRTHPQTPASPPQPYEQRIPVGVGAAGHSEPSAPPVHDPYAR